MSLASSNKQEETKVVDVERMYYHVKAKTLICMDLLGEEVLPGEYKMHHVEILYARSLRRHGETVFRLAPAGWRIWDSQQARQTHAYYTTRWMACTHSSMAMT